MIKNKKYNKSVYFDNNNSPNLYKKRLSTDFNKEKIEEENGLNSFKYSLKKIDKNKFKNIPKNEKLMNYSTILLNNNTNLNNPHKRKSFYENVLNRNRVSFENSTNIKKKNDDTNIRVSSLIPISKKRFNKSKMKTIKEKENLVYNILKKNYKRSGKLNGSYGCFTDDIYSKISSKKKNENFYNSSHALLKIKKRTKKLTGITGIESAKIIPKVKKLSKRQLIVLNDNNDIEKNNIKDKKINKTKNNIKKNNNKRNENSKNGSIDNNKFGNNKNYNNNEERNVVNIDNVKTKNEYEIENCTTKEKKRKSLGFPFCCLTSKDDNSSENE